MVVHVSSQSVPAVDAISPQPVTKSINQSTRIYIAPYVAGESEARTGLG